MLFGANSLEIEKNADERITTRVLEKYMLDVATYLAMLRKVKYPGRKLKQKYLICCLLCSQIVFCPFKDIVV